MEMKITIDQLKNYLGTGLKFEAMYFNKPFEGEMDLHNFMNFIDQSIESKLKLYRLSDIDKFIPELGFVPLYKLNKFKELGTGKMTSNGWEKDTVGICDHEIEKNLSIIGGGHWEGGIEEIELFQFFNLYQQLFKWHFWPFGEEYFEQGLDYLLLFYL